MKLCKNTDCIAEKSDENEKCGICDGYYIDDVMKPFIEWSDKEQTKYSLYHGNLLRSIFEALSNGDENIVETVEAFDLWYNS